MIVGAMYIWPSELEWGNEPLRSRPFGGVAEWLKAAVLKTVDRSCRSGGSNPSSSATCPGMRSLSRPSETHVGKSLLLRIRMKCTLYILRCLRTGNQRMGITTDLQTQLGAIFAEKGAQRLVHPEIMHIEQLEDLASGHRRLQAIRARWQNNPELNLNPDQPGSARRSGN